MRNVLLISIDNLRFDCIGYQKNKQFLADYGVLNLLKTPNLDSFANKSICFSHAFSPGTYTTLSHASVLTGLYPQRHNIRGFMNVDDGRLSQNVMSLAEVYKENGYQTVLLTDVPAFFKGIDLTRGFDHMIGLNDKQLFNYIKKHNNKPLFVFAHFFDIHFPFLLSSYEYTKNYNNDYVDKLKKTYKAYGEKWPGKINNLKLWNNLWNRPGRANTHSLLPLYMKGVTKFDRGRFAYFMKNLDILLPKNNRVTLIFSDHGEGKSNPNELYFSHAGALYDSVIRVVMMIQAPQIKKHRVCNSLTSLVDIYPTLINLSLDKNNALIPQYNVDGINLLDDKPLNKRKYIYSEVSSSNNPRELHSTKAEWTLRERCIRTKKFKYIVRGRPEELLEKRLYDLDEKSFVRCLYRGIFYRFEDSDGFKKHTHDLKSGNISKKGLVKSFLEGDEHKIRKTFVYFDLEFDPHERFELDPVVSGNRDYKYYLKKIISMEQKKDCLSLGLLPYEDILSHC